MNAHTDLYVSDVILRAEVARLDARLGEARREITRLREDGLRKDRHISRLTETECKAVAALSLALQNFTDSNPARAEFWVRRCLEEMGVDADDPDLREHYRAERESLAYAVQQEEFEDAERFNEWRRQPIAAE